MQFNLFSQKRKQKQWLNRSISRITASGDFEKDAKQYPGNLYKQTHHLTGFLPALIMSHSPPKAGGAPSVISLS